MSNCPEGYIGIDFGTSGCRTLAIDQTGSILAQHRLPLPASHRDQQGSSLQSPAAWLEALLALLEGLSSALGPLRDSVKTLAIDGTSASLLACASDGTPLHPALMYDDRQAWQQAEALQAIAPADSPVLSASSSLAKLLLLQKQLSRPFLALHQSDWLLGQLCGAFGHSDENNALKLGYDPLQRRWPEWMQPLQLPAGTLPQVHPIATPIAPLRASIAQQIGLPADCWVCTGTTDSTAAILASGVDRPGQGVTVLGTTLVVKLLSPQPIFHAGYGVYSHRLGDLWLVGGASNSGGGVLRQFFTPAQMNALTPQLAPQHSTGLDYYPLPAMGERFPINDANKAPCLEPRPADEALFFQGLLEGMARIEALGYERLRQLGAPQVSEILSLGGGAGNLAWQQIRQRIGGVPIRQAAQQEAAYGAALLARQAAQTLRSSSCNNRSSKPSAAPR